jgi:hypothetical protein
VFLISFVNYRLTVCPVLQIFNVYLCHKNWTDDDSYPILSSYGRNKKRWGNWDLQFLMLGSYKDANSFPLIFLHFLCCFCALWFINGLLLCICFSQISFYSALQRGSSIQESLRTDAIYSLITSSIVRSSLFIQLMKKFPVMELKIIITIIKFCHWTLP